MLEADILSGDILRTVTGYCSQKYQTGSIYVGETLQETETYQRSQQTVKMYEKYFCNFLKREIDILKYERWVAENNIQPIKKTMELEIVKSDEDWIKIFGITGYKS